MNSREALEVSIQVLGLQATADLVGRRYQAVQQWVRRGRLPRTEYTGETNYAALIVAACREKDPATRITRDALLGLSPHASRLTPDSPEAAHA